MKNNFPALDFLNPESGLKPPDSEIISQDREGNKIFVKNGKVFLKLMSEDKPRNIGSLSENKKIFRCERKRRIHLHRISNSYGFNRELIESLPELETIILSDEHDNFTVPVSLIKNGVIMNFKNSSDGNQYELQYFVSLQKLKGQK